MPVLAPFSHLAPIRRLTGVAVLTALALSAAACSRVPELENQLSADLRSQPYPKLLPLGTALAAEPLPEEESAALQQSLDARAAELKRRADALKQREP